MKGDPEQRAVQLGEYIAANRATVRGSGVRVQQVHRAQGCCGAAADAAAGAVPAGAGGSGLQ